MNSNTDYPTLNELNNVRTKIDYESAKVINNIQSHEMENKELHVYEYSNPNNIIIVEERREPIYHDVKMNKYPIVSTKFAVLILFINIFLPGIGTLIISCISNDPGYFILFGLGQILTAWIIVGWVWALFTSLKLLSHSKKK